MPLDPATIDAMVTAGFSAEQIATVVKAELVADQARDGCSRPGARDRERARERREECDADTWTVLKAYVIRRDGATCRYCGSFRGPMHVDHVVPLCQGGRSFVGNLVCACHSCNSAKGGRTPAQWGVAWP